MNAQSPMSVDITRLTIKQRHNISMLLNQHCKAVDGYSVYEKGWDDDRIAQQTGVQPGSVGYMRRGVFGKRKPVVAAPRKKDVVEARLARLEDQVAKLVASLGGVA